MHSTLKPERKERLLSLLALAVTAAAYLPYVLAARYAIFHSDDYAFCTGTLAEPNGQLLSASLHRAWNSYMTWQGTFVPNLINPLFNPLNWYSYALLRLILIACLAAVFLAALLLCREICLILKMKGMGCRMLISRADSVTGASGPRSGCSGTLLRAWRSDRSPGEGLFRNTVP